ncbi:MAG: hypothetical protein N0C84_05655 [Candidatus Thiodiazotropha taylori]|uniref:Uncharacterized protein n=1 Tax=Candidatus Thiodiazotropha taylori TaxID=2792791 RepID=A0A9E4N2X2_9GAMM|nr:hypothetical protein [Candidatus Thiodiazotropha taylori]MCW4255938.1 hypothetical protein [Candidatus Thiodiazotropha taylori]
MRKVNVFKYESRIEGDKRYLEKVADGQAIFHAFGVDYEEFETGPGNFSTAIIERENGEVENVYVGMVQFIDAE